MYRRSIEDKIRAHEVILPGGANHGLPPNIFMTTNLKRVFYGLRLLVGY